MATSIENPGIDQGAELTRTEYELFRELIYSQSGINLGEQKMQLLRARLGKRMRVGSFKSFRAYYDYIRNDPTGDELCELLNAVSTNTTHFFRESKHFEFLAVTLRSWMTDSAWRAKHNPVRIWSAASSTGEEPYSIAMTVHDLMQDMTDLTFKILATDISTRVLERAKRGVYPATSAESIPQVFRSRYLTKTRLDGDSAVQIRPELARHVRFERFNLMNETFPFRNPFDIIFCRNVMIYFDRPTQEKLVARFYRHLAPGGYLLIGHSESLQTLSHPFTYRQATVYQKPHPSDAGD